MSNYVANSNREIIQPWSEGHTVTIKRNEYSRKPRGQFNAQHTVNILDKMPCILTQVQAWR